MTDRDDHAARLRDRAARLFAVALRAREDGNDQYAEELTLLASEAIDQATDLELPEAGSGALGMGGGKSFAHWLQIGFAVTLPLIIFGIVALLVFFWMAAKTQ